MTGYDLYGIALAVDSDDAGVAGAIDQRLRLFRGGAPAGSLALTVRCGGAPPAAAAGGRPVYEAPGGTIAYDGAADTLAGSFEGVALVCSPRRGHAEISSAAFDGRRRYLAAHPLTTICLIELLRRRGRFAMHAGCVASESGDGVLIAGPRGVGKSTLAMGLAERGVPFLSDDTVFLMPAADGVRALGFPDAIGLVPAPGTGEQTPDAGFPKRLIRPEAIAGARLAPSCRPGALVFPELTGGPSSALEELDPRDAWLRVMRDILVTDAAAVQAHMDVLGELIAQVRCYTLRAGRDPAAAADRVAGLL